MPTTTRFEAAIKIAIPIVARTIASVPNKFPARASTMNELCRIEPCRTELITLTSYLNNFVTTRDNTVAIPKLVKITIAYLLKVSLSRSMVEV